MYICGMTIPYFYEPDEYFDQLALSEATMHHALMVLRMKRGDCFWLTNGCGKKVKCEIDEVSKKHCGFHATERVEEVRHLPKIIIAISFTKNAARNEWLLEKITEMGVSEIVPMMCHRTEKQHLRRDRLDKIVVSAMLQSQQTFLPKLHDPMPMSDVIKLESDTKLIAYCGDEVPKVSLKDTLAPNESVLMLIGPEGDFTPDEIQNCLQHHIKPVSLGVTRLRTETAGMFVCAVFNAINS